MNGIKLKCQRCKHIWTYKGKKEWAVSCPNCYTKVSISKNKLGGETNE